MALSSSFSLASRTGPPPPPELVRGAAEACRVVLHEVRRRIDSTVTNSAVKGELRHGLTAAEAVLAAAERPATASSHRSGASGASGSPLSSVEAQEHTQAGRTAAPPVQHQLRGARTTTPGHKDPMALGGHATPPADGASAPPLPARESAVTRPTAKATASVTGVLSPNKAVSSPTRRSSAGAGEEGSGRAEQQHVSNVSVASGAASAVAESSVHSSWSSSAPLGAASQSADLWGLLLSAVFWKRRRLTEHTIAALELLLRAVPLSADLLVSLVVDPALLNADHNGGSGGGVPRARRVARRPGRMLTSAPTAVFYALSECLLQSFSEPATQTRALRLISELIASSPCCADGADAARGQGHGAGSGSSAMLLFCGHAAIRVVESCFSVAAEGAQDAVRHEARLALRATVQRVVYAFVTMQARGEVLDDPDGIAEAHTVFSTDTILSDYTVDVDHSEPYTAIRLVPSTKAPAPLSASLRSDGLPLAPAAAATATAAASAAVAGRSGGAPGGVDKLMQTTAESSSRGGGGGGSGPLTGSCGGASTAAPSRQPSVGMVCSDAALGDTEAGPDAAAPSPLRSQPPACANVSASLPNLSFDPHALFRSSVDESLVQEALSTLNTTDGALPGPLKDLLMVLRRMCRCASRPCSGTPNDTNAEVRTRDLGLWVLECVLDRLPVANCEQEHRCATWVSLVLHACKYELMGCLAKNLAMAIPFSLFERAVHLLGLLLRKVHYHMARELHTLLGAFLLPLMGSQYAGFRQKHTVLSMIRQLFAVPHLCVSFFINYDCNPAFDPGAEYGGMLELLVEHVAGMTFLDHVDESGEAYPWLSSDQQQLLRSECVVVVHTLVASLHRWIAEDPQEYAEGLRRSAASEARRRQHQDSSSGGGGGVLDANELAELYLDNWESDEAACPHPQPADAYGATRVASGEDGDDGSTHPSEGGLHSRHMTLVLDAATGAAVSHWGKHRNIEYHWKHIHYLLHNKRIAQEAVQRVNAGRWREAKALLESRGFMATSIPSAAERADPASVVAGTSSYVLFAHFLFEYPGISRDAISAIFEKVNHKDGAPRLVLREYLHCFSYVDVPVDVAMRDTTCKFMSWDRPMFEAKVWETIQQCFGDEYARQNPGSITARDADVMAGVLLFLHSNLHNRVVKNDRMSASQFVRDANACLEFPMMDEDLHAMFERVLQRKWELDMYGCTPQQAERERTLVRLSTKIQLERAAQWRRQSGPNAKANNSFHTPPGAETLPSLVAATRAAAAAAAAATGKVGPSAAETDSTVLDDVLNGAEESESNSHHSSFAVAGTPTLNTTTAAIATPTAAAAAAVPVLNGSMDGSTLQAWMCNDVALLDGTIPLYADKKDTLKVKEEQHHSFHEVAAVHLHKLESVHRRYCIEAEAYRPQPYVVPFYAEHARQMLLLTYPHVMATVYMGFRILEEAPIARKLLDTVQITYDIAAAFVLNLRDLRPVMDEVLQRYLDDEQAYRLLPPSRATFVPFSMHVL
ncbi:Guanine nucleotide exchange factor in Golgi transport [Novymonas esmeraldas]|uniref:Guanine nucleotide exchange factor in Golgi transport n=1 Tax=Novymonas esmeraldas TaxID=1808958 RepID=A0AAW0F5X4_9TRYP